MASTGFAFGGTTKPGGLFGTRTTTAAPTISVAPLFGNSATSTTKSATGPSLFGGQAFGSAFGSTQASTTTSAFGAGSNFFQGSTFGNKTTTAPNLGFGGFGTGQTGFTTAAKKAPTFPTFGTVDQATAVTSAVQGVTVQSDPSSLPNMAAALFNPAIFGDERDQIIAKWNQLQASWGIGHGYFSQQAPPVVFGVDNAFCRYKAIGYNRIPQAKDEDGICSLIFSRKDTDIRSQQQIIVDSLHQILGASPTVSVCVDGIKPLINDRTEMTIYVMERQPTGFTRRVTTTDLYKHLDQAHIKTQLAQLSVENLIPKIVPSKDQLCQYLEIPPPGVDPLLWQQAKLDNPDASKFIPVPMVGFPELLQRLQVQTQETKIHLGRLQMIRQNLEALQRDQLTTRAKLEDGRRKLMELGHRLLKVMVAQEVSRKAGYAISTEEEELKVQLEALQAELNVPKQFKGRVQELLTCANMLGEQRQPEELYTIDANTQHEMKQFLKQQQEGLSHLVSIMKEDMVDLELIENNIKADTGPRRR